MIFSPLLIVATASLLSSSASASPTLFGRQQADAASEMITDPHAAPDVPSDHTTPIADGGNSWKEAFAKAQAVVEQMTIEEKSNVTTGFDGPCAGNTGAVERLGIPSICLTDGPAGVRPADLVSQFPAGVSVAATFDHDLMYHRAHKMAAEFKGKGVNVLLGPSAGGPIGRSPLMGRNWEGFSADVYLNAIAAKLSVAGISDQGVMACSKHWIAHEQEYWRNQHKPTVNGGNRTLLYQMIDSQVDDTTLHELYIPGFAESIRAGSATIMCAYNAVNGIHACQNEYLQNEVLKGELNFQGAVVSDWGASWDTLKDAAYGLDLSMPGNGYGGLLGNFFGKELINVTESGALSDARLTDMAIRTLTPWYAAGQDSPDYPRPNFDANSLATNSTWGNQHVDVQEDHYKIIRQIGEESMTLLKNERGSLPITKSTRRIGVFGSSAGPHVGGLTGYGDFNRAYEDPATRLLRQQPSRPNGEPNGTVTMGGGSGYVYPPYIVNPLEAIALRGRHDHITVDYELDTDPLRFPYVARVAESADKAIVFVSAFQSESGDRKDLKLLHNADELINVVALHNADVTVVIHSGQTVDMEAWIENENVTSVVFAYYPGQESGNAITSVLFGDVSPSGKLPFTVGKTIDDYPGGAGGIVRDDVFQPNATFSEGVYVDYKWFDKQNIEPRFPFGFGLSYSNFSYSDATVKETFAADTDFKQLTNEKLEGEGGLYDLRYTVGVTVRNTGDIEAAEVAQVYLTYPDGVTQPIRNLRGFCKEKYAAGESQTLTFPIRAKDMAVWVPESRSWSIPSGEFTFSIGSSSRDLPVSVTLQV